ncbi:response regulator [Gaetbulibacter aestuarii]|uniref:Response regulator n=1 Tax=Gaetbulibacter aestuarii TaxID=1502358 RepID=A0ABW7N049_9FLAO
MFNKVLIVDDHDAVNAGVLSVLKNLGFQTVDTAQYCDDAFLKIKRAAFDQVPYDLLISDLSFKKEFRNRNLLSGEDLVKAVRPDYPKLPIIIYSMEDRLQKVRTLIKTQGVNAYVCKGRKGSVDLAMAMEAISKGDIFVSPQVEQALNPDVELEIDDYDLTLIKQLSIGHSQSEISIYLQENNMSPSSLSSIEKRLNRLKDQFQANNVTHLVAIFKDLGLF